MYTNSQMRIIAVIAAFAVLGWLTPAAAQQEASFTDPKWPEETTHEFAIMDSAGNRIATAYYRILQEVSEGREVYRFKYVGRNQQMSEAAECWVHRSNLQPLRSTRKVVDAGRTFYQDIAYTDGVVVVRRKYEGGEVNEREISVGTNLFDYEEMMWIIPLLDFAGQPQIRFNIFAALTGRQATILLTDGGVETVTVNKQNYTARTVLFDMEMTAHKMWIVNQEGRPVPAKLDMGSTSFINLRLDPKLCDAPLPPPAPEPEKPKEEEKPEPKPEEDPPLDPGANPLGPPPPGHRF